MRRKEDGRQRGRNGDTGEDNQKGQQEKIYSTLEGEKKLKMLTKELGNEGGDEQT